MHKPSKPQLSKKEQARRIAQLEHMNLELLGASRQLSEAYQAVRGDNEYLEQVIGHLIMALDREGFEVIIDGDLINAKFDN